VATVVVVVVAGWLLSLVFHGPGDARAIELSAVVAIVVQLVAFAVAVTRPPKEAIIGRGIGSLLRFGTLVVYAVLVAKVLLLPLSPALVGLAAFFFLTTLIEPLFLKR
jgi:hypothetical protein